MERYFYRHFYGEKNEVNKNAVKQILPLVGGRTSLVLDNDYLTHLHAGDGRARTQLRLGNRKFRFNCVRFANCEVHSEYVCSLDVFAQTVIIEDSSLNCEDVYFNLLNELEVRSGKMRFRTMRVEAKWVNIERQSLLSGNQLIVTAFKSACLLGGFNLENQFSCRSHQISVGKHSAIATNELLLLPTKSLEIRGTLRSRKLFIGHFNERQMKVASCAAKVEISGKVEGDRLSIMSGSDVVLSGRVYVNEMDISSGKEVKVEKCRLRVRKLQVHAHSTSIDAVSVLEGTEFSFLIEDKVTLADLSSFQFDGILAIHCRSLLCEGNEETSTSSTFRSGDFYVTAAESIQLGGELKCKKLILKCEQRAANVTIQQNANFDVDSLLVFGNGSMRRMGMEEDGEEIGEVVFDSGSVILCSMFVAIEVDEDVVVKGALKRALSYSPNLFIKTSKSIKFVNCAVDVGESQLIFGNEIILDDRVNVYVNGKLFMLHHLKQNNAGVLRLAEDCVVVARKEIVCQFGECFVEGTLVSEGESILLGQNNNQAPISAEPEGTVGKKEVKINQMIKSVVQSIKPSSKPLLSLFNRVQEKRTQLIQFIQRTIHLKEEVDDRRSFVMTNIFISGDVSAKKTIMLVSRDITIMNGSSIKCTSAWDSTAILIYSNRSVFQCSSELDASTVLIVSPIVFQLLSLIKAHSLSISAAVVFRLACVCNSTKTILKSPLILSGLNVVVPNLSKTLHKMRTDLVESFADVVMLIEKLAQARTENREFEVFLMESMRLFKKHSHLALLHSLELVHFVFQIVNMILPKTALIVTVNVMSIVRATLFLLFSVKNIHKSIKRYLTSERQNFILVEIIGEAMFSLFQVVGVVTSFTSLLNQIKSIRCSSINYSSIPTLKDLPRTILNRTRDLVSSGPLSALSNVLGVFDTFVLNDYTKYAVGLFSYLPSSMSFSLFNLSGDMQLGMYVVINSSTCSLNGSVIVLSYNCSSTDLASFNTRSNVVICNGGIYETSTIGRLDRGVKIGQRSLVLAGGRRVNDGGFHFGETVVLKTKRFGQQGNRLYYNQLGGFSMKEWKLNRSEFRPVSSSKGRDYTPASHFSSTTNESAIDAFDSDVIIAGVDMSILRSGNVIESVSVGDGSVFFLRDVVLKMSSVSGVVTAENVRVKVSDQLMNMSTLQIARGRNFFAFDGEVDVNFSIQLAEGGHVSIVSPSTTVNCKTMGEGHVAFHNAEIGEKANIQHTGSTFIELKNDQRLSDAIAGNDEYSRIANNGQVNFKVNDAFVISASDERVFNSETSIREEQVLGIIADSIEICRDVVRKNGIQLFSVEEDVVIRESITSKDGSVVINAQKGNVIIEDSVEKGIIVTKCQLESKPSSVSRSRLERNVVLPSFYRPIIVDGVDIVKNVEKVELRANDSVVITANEGSIIMDPCLINGNESVVLQGKKGVAMKDICVTSVSRKGSRNPFYSKHKKVIEGVSETTFITSGGDISIISSEGTTVTSGINVTSSGGRILQSGRDGVYNLSAVSKTSINEKVRVWGGLSREQRIEKHEVETPCVFESAEGIYVESEKGSIVNVGVIVTGNGVCSFNAGENVLFERRILKHEVSVKKQGFNLSLSVLGVDIFESSSSFFENLKLEFLENHLPPIGNSPVEVARSIREGNVPEIAANTVNTLLIPGNLRFILEAPVKFGLKFNDYELHHHQYDTLGEGKVEIDHLFIKAVDTVEFSNGFGFNAGSLEIEAHKLIENGAYLNYEVENFSSGLSFGFEPLGSDLSQCVPSLSADLSIAKESCSVAVCQVGNTAFMKVDVDEWEKSGSQTFVETIQGRVGTVSFNSTSTVGEGKMHGISLGTTSLGLSDGHSKSSLIIDQTGLFAVNSDEFHVKTVILESSRCPVRGTVATIAEESMEFEKVSGTSLGVDFSGFLSLSVMAGVGGGGGNQKISKLKGVGIEKKNYMAVVQNSFESVNESEFHYRSIDSPSQIEDVEREAMMSDMKLAQSKYRTLTRSDNSLFLNESGSDSTRDAKRSTVLIPVKKVLKDRSFKLKFHYDRNYHVIHEGIEKMHKEVVDEGLLPCLEGAAFEDVDPQLLYPVLDIFYDPSTSELDKYTQMLFYRDGEKSKFGDLTESEKHEVFIYQSYLQNGGDFRDYISLCNFYEEKKQSLSDEYAKKSMKEYVRETYPELYLLTGLHEVQNVDEVQRIFMDIKFAYEPDDPMVRQLTFEMDQYYAEQLFDASWAELSSTQQKEIVKIREHALIYQQTDQEVNFGEYLYGKEVQFVDYFANHHQEPDTSVLTSFGVLPIELLKEPDPILSECMPYEAPQFDNERKYPVPGSGLFFLPAAPEASGWEGICEYGSTIKNCIRDHFVHLLAGRPSVDYQPSQIEVFRDKSLRSFVSGVLNFIPYVNGAKWSYQGIAGFDPITKDRLDWKERVIDLTFSMFYFQPIANVIVGYGKGAVLEPLKGTWMAGKIIGKDRTLKGVFETMKITGSAAIESISLPTQHLGTFLEMKMMWGVNSGAATFRSASFWFSNKMQSWKSGFWSKWKWSRKHFDVVTARFASSYCTEKFAFAGGKTTFSGNGCDVFNKNQPTMQCVSQDVSGGIPKVRGPNGPVIGEEKRAIVIDLIVRKLYTKLTKLKVDGKAMMQNLPKLQWRDYEGIAMVFNAEMREGGHENISRTAEQVRQYRTVYRKEVVQKLRRLISFNYEYGRKDNLADFQNIDHCFVHRLSNECTETLVDMISCELLSKAVNLGGNYQVEVRKVPKLSMSDYEVIAKRFNEKLEGDDLRYARTVEQLRQFRGRQNKRIVQRFREIINSEPDENIPNAFLESPLLVLDHSRHIRSQYSDILIELLAEKLFTKLPKNLDNSVFTRRLPQLELKEYEEIAESFNAKLDIDVNPQLKDYKRTALQVRTYRVHNRRAVAQKLREMMPRFQDGGDEIGGNFVDRYFHVLPEEFMDFLVELISWRIHVKLPKGYDMLKLNDSKVLVEGDFKLKSREYEMIADIYNGEPRVVANPEYARSVKQIKKIRNNKRLQILRNVKRMRKEEIQGHSRE